MLQKRVQKVLGYKSELPEYKNLLSSLGISLPVDSHFVVRDAYEDAVSARLAGI